MSKAKIPDGFWGFKGPSGPYLAVRSGHTRRALSPGRTFRTGTVVVGVVGHPGAHVKAHEEGQLVIPKVSRFLRIPTREALTPSGVDRNLGRSVKGQPKTFILRSRAGKLWIAQGQGPRVEPKLLYLLVSSVRLPARHLFREALRRQRPSIVVALGEGVQTALKVA